jgi:hypothetical protein
MARPQCDTPLVCLYPATDLPSGTEKYHTYVSLHNQPTPSMQQLFNKIIKCGLHNPLLCKTAFSHEPKLNFLLLRLWWPRGKKVWCIRWQGTEEGCNPMLIINCCCCQLLWRWIMIFLCVGLNEYLLSLPVLITTFLNSYVSRFVLYWIHALSNLSLLSPLSTFNIIQQTCLTNNALPEELTSSIL